MTIIVQRMVILRILHLVVCFVCPEVSEEPAVSIFRVTELFQVDPSVTGQIPLHPNSTASTRTNSATLKMEAIHFSETSEQTKYTTWCKNSE
jgi:hypothetical protein